MATQSELDLSRVSAASVADALAEPDSELQGVVHDAVREAFENSEVKEAFRKLFTAEELEVLATADEGEVEAALREVLADDPGFRDAVLENVSEWVGQVSIDLPGDEAALDSFVQQWQLPTDGVAS
jgi:hypothetical protein